MKAALLLSFLIAGLVGGQVRAAGLELGAYQDREGAITVYHQGDFVDPYFALKALLTAHEAGLDIRQAAMPWIEWLLARQETSGLFRRFCLQDGAWTACKDADADDALLAMWIELLYLMAPDSGLPPQWTASAHLAQQQLTRLRNATSGIYFISSSLPVGLFIDNVEIYAALRTIGKRQKRMGAQAAARNTIRQAVQLRQRIETVFHPVVDQPYRVSTQALSEWHFYPQTVAQIYPLLHRMPASEKSRRAQFDTWLAQYGADWLSFLRDDYPWGLVAVVALQVGDCRTALRWMRRAAPLRHSARWNVLEEATMQIVEAAPALDMACQMDPISQ